VFDDRLREGRENDEETARIILRVRERTGAEGNIELKRVWSEFL